MFWNTEAKKKKAAANQHNAKINQEIHDERKKQAELERPTSYNGWWSNPVTITEEYNKCLEKKTFVGFISAIQELGLRDELELVFVKLNDNDLHKLDPNGMMPMKHRETYKGISAGNFTWVQRNNLPVTNWILIRPLTLEGIDTSNIEQGVLIWKTIGENVFDFLLHRDFPA